MDGILGLWAGSNKKGNLMEEEGRETTSLSEDAFRLRKMADRFAVNVDRLLEEKNSAQVVAMSHAEMCAKMVHVDSVEKAAEILLEAASQVDKVDSVAVWVEEKHRLVRRAVSGMFTGFEKLSVPRTVDGRYDLTDLITRRFVDMPELKCYYPVPIFHPGNGPVGIAEYGSEKTDKFSKVNKRVLCGITDTAATVIGRLTVCRQLEEVNSKYEALSKVSDEAVAVFHDGELFATNELFDFMREQADDKEAMLEQVKEFSRLEPGSDCRAIVSGQEMHVRVTHVTYRKDGNSVAVVMTHWQKRGD